VTLVLMIAFVSRNNAQHQNELRAMLGGLLDCAIGLAFRLDGKIGIAMLAAAAETERACAARDQQMAAAEQGTAEGPAEAGADVGAAELHPSADVQAGMQARMQAGQPADRGTALRRAGRSRNHFHARNPARGAALMRPAAVHLAIFPHGSFPDRTLRDRRLKSRLGGLVLGLP
jgi:hypothetical protein